MDKEIQPRDIPRSPIGVSYRLRARYYRLLAKRDITLLTGDMKERDRIDVILSQTEALQRNVIRMMIVERTNVH